MIVAVGIPVYNDEVFLERSVQNCLDVGYDYVVYLDDGSTDNTYSKLMDLTKGHSEFKVIKKEQNSVFSNDGNRWEIVSKECQKINPDWIMVRAADECLSYAAFKEGPNLLRKNIEFLDQKKINMITFSYVDLWRSEWWYRVDGFWGSQRISINAWKNNTGWIFESGAGLHRGRHRPYKMNVKDFQANINVEPSDTIRVLHYGMSSHDFIAKKLDYQISTALSVKGRSYGVPLKMPHPSVWHDFNGYKVAYEKNIVLKKVEQSWFKNPVPDVPKPVVKSLYNVVVKYDKNMAEEYAKIYGR